MSRDSTAFPAPQALSASPTVRAVNAVLFHSAAMTRPGNSKPVPIHGATRAADLAGVVAGLSVARFYIMWLFERRFFARVVAEITTRAVYAQNPFFADQSRVDLFNRYFDMVTVQKAVPSLVIMAFTILLQSAVGLIVTSFYHPFFLAFNLVLVATFFLIWGIWVRPSIDAAVALSHAKDNTARWLESVGG